MGVCSSICWCLLSTVPGIYQEYTHIQYYRLKWSTVQNIKTAVYSFYHTMSCYETIRPIIQLQLYSHSHSSKMWRTVCSCLNLHKCRGNVELQHALELNITDQVYSNNYSNTIYLLLHKDIIDTYVMRYLVSWASCGVYTLWKIYKRVQLPKLSWANTKKIITNNAVQVHVLQLEHQWF